jgi:hypothetical protein
MGLEIQGALPFFSSSLLSTLKFLPNNDIIRELSLRETAFDGMIPKQVCELFRRNLSLEKVMMGPFTDWLLVTLNKSGRRYIRRENTKEKGVDFLINLQKTVLEDEEQIKKHWMAAGVAWWPQDPSSVLLTCLFEHLRENATVFFGQESTSTVGEPVSSAATESSGRVEARPSTDRAKIA